MNDFVFYSPTKFVFGKAAEQKVGAELKAAGYKQVLLHYGQSSVKRSGLLDTIKAQLEIEGIEYHELGGVRPNPEIALVREGIALARELEARGKALDFILCLGGGSVIDSAKAISAGLHYQGDVWDFYLRGADTEAMLVDPIDLGSVLTIPAAGSEASSGTVLSNDELQMKSSFGSPRLRPVLAFMNPELTMSLPAWQSAAGITDMYAHLCERFFSKTDFVAPSDALALALFKTLVSMGPRVIKDPQDYEARAAIMWSGTLCHNGLTGCGREEDWITHALEHELSARKTEITHGAGLAVMFPAWMRYVCKQKPERFALYGREVFGLQASEDIFKDAQAAIDATQSFFSSLGMPSRLLDLGIEVSDIEPMLEQLQKNRGESFGSFAHLSLEDARKIYESAL